MQNEVAPLAVITGLVGAVDVITLTGADGKDEQPLASTALTVKLPAADTLMLCPVCPELHTLLAPALELSVRVLPTQIVVEPTALTTGVAGGGVAKVVMTVAADVAEQPYKFLAVSVYVPAVLTVILAVVAPLLQL